MKFIERFEELKKQEKVIQDKFEDLKESLKHRDWLLALHTHYNEPTVSVWKYDDEIASHATFSIEGNYVEMRSAGMYLDNWQEAENILNEWLSQDFSEECI